MMNFIPDSVIRAVCWSLLHSLWQGLILAVVAGIVMVLTKRSSSSVRYNLLCCLLLVFLMVSGYTFYREMHAPAASGWRSAGMIDGANTGTAGGAGLTGATTQGALSGGTDAAGTLIQYFNTHASLLVVLWFIVFLARFVKVMSGLVHAQRIRYYGTSQVPAEWQTRLADLLAKIRLKRTVLLLESALIKVPAVVGFLKPVILVPVGMLAQLPADQVESILLHELAHISRRDYLFNLVQHLVDTLFFFNPALLWVSSLIRSERENCCDDVAIRETRSRKRLIEALVAFHQYKRGAEGYMLSFAGKDNRMVKRVERIVYKQNHSLNLVERVFLMAGLIVLCAAFVTIDGSRQSKSPASSVPVFARLKVTPQKKVPKEVALKVTTPKVTTPKATAPQVTPQQVKVPEQTVAQKTVQALTADTTLPLTDADVEKWIRCRDHGVTREYIAELKKLGYPEISLDKAIELKDHGVDAAFILALKSEGYKKISLDEATELIDHGVSVEFIRRIRGLGFPNLSLEKSIMLVDHGVTGDFIANWKKKTGTLMELDDYIKLQDSGIDPSQQAGPS